MIAIIIVMSMNIIKFFSLLLSLYLFNETFVPAKICHQSIDKLREKTISLVLLSFFMKNFPTNFNN